MKKVSLALALVFLCSLAAFAQNSGPSSTGSFQFNTSHGTQTIEFNARKQNNGTTSGQITFTGPAEIPDQDTDGEGGGPGGTFTTFSIQVEVDCLRLAGNRAAMSGAITSSSVIGLVGRKMILTVEDNGEGRNQPQPDRFTWGLYRLATQGWIPSDSELEFDNGASLTWNATDFEREDDVPVPARPNASFDCNTFSLSSYAPEDLMHGNGNIQVRP